MAKKRIPEEVSEYFRQLGLKNGAKGGKARAANLTAEQRSTIAKKAVDAREAKRKATKKRPTK